MYSRFTLLCALVVVLSGCQTNRLQNYISDQNKLYIAAVAAPPLKIPAHLDSTTLSTEQVSIVSVPTNNTGVISPNLLPPGSYSAQIKAGTLPDSILKTKLPDPE